MKFTHEAVVALDQINRNVILSVDKLSGIIKWELLEGGLVKDKNIITNLGKFILRESKKRGII